MINKTLVLLALVFTMNAAFAAPPPMSPPTGWLWFYGPKTTCTDDIETVTSWSKTCEYADGVDYKKLTNRSYCPSSVNIVKTRSVWKTQTICNDYGCSTTSGWVDEQYYSPLGLAAVTNVPHSVETVVGQTCITEENVLQTNKKPCWNLSGRPGSMPMCHF